MECGFRDLLAELDVLDFGFRSGRMSAEDYEAGLRELQRRADHSLDPKVTRHLIPVLRDRRDCLVPLVTD